jgi:hypothetical protein
MRIHRRTDLTLDDLARWLNPIVAGWINYYGRSTGRRSIPSCGAGRVGNTDGCEPKSATRSG